MLCSRMPLDSNDSCVMGVREPENWDLVKSFAESPRTTYQEIREARPDQAVARKAMMDFVRNSGLENCVPQTDYIQSLGLRVP